MLRLVVPRPTWDDLLHLAFDEIRTFGVASIQIPRRLRAALDDLHAAAPPERRAAVDDQLAALDRAVAAAYPHASDRDRASTPDAQGLR